MALPNPALIQTGLQQLYLAFAEDKTERGMRTAVNHLSWLTGTLNFLYGVPTNIALTADSTDAGVSEFIGGGDGDALSVGDVFRFTGTATDDLTDNALATAKGSATAVGDIYVISGADAVVYMGNNSGVIFDGVGESAADFKSIGS